MISHRHRTPSDGGLSEGSLDHLLCFTTDEALVNSLALQCRRSSSSPQLYNKEDLYQLLDFTIEEALFISSALQWKRSTW
uniref:Uncharacterized protein n=1 Tax=Cannabis sativa TaxID=3483 RepID=A0A803P5U1_CANSA